MRHVLPGQVPLSEAPDRLAHAVRERGGGSPTLRVEQPVEPVDLLAWLAAQPHAVRMYWEDRDGDFAIAGVGCSQLLEADHLAELSHAAEDHRLITGRFDAAGTPAESWRPFGAVRSYLPAIALRREDGATVLACHVSATGTDEVLRATADLSPPAPDVPLELRFERVDHGDAARWTRSVESVLAGIRTGVLHKAVLANQRVCTAQQAPCPIRLLAALPRADTPAFRFCLQPEPGLAFLGASPELLYRRRGSRIASEALAGTRPRSHDPDEDAKLAAELLGSDKDLREHELVRGQIRSALEPLCSGLDTAGDPSLLRLAYVQHLCSPFEGTLHPGVTDAEILARLHPTPAVCGHPADVALEHIGAHENFDRGLYSGPIGWAGPDRADVAVAIRCALVRGRELSIYAGAGIVEGSDPEAEWQETISKMEVFSAWL